MSAAIPGRRVGIYPLGTYQRDHRSVPRHNPAHADLPDWTGAACIGEDPELWFPIGAPILNPDGEDAAMICRRCPIRGRCLTWADQHPELSRDGIWGGLDPDQRTARARRKAQGMTPRNPATPDPAALANLPLELYEAHAEFNRWRYMGAQPDQLPRRLRELESEYQRARHRVRKAREA